MLLVSVERWKQVVRKICIIKINKNKKLRTAELDVALIFLGAAVALSTAGSTTSTKGGIEGTFFAFFAFFLLLGLFLFRIMGAAVMGAPMTGMLSVSTMGACINVVLTAAFGITFIYDAVDVSAIVFLIGGATGAVIAACFCRKMERRGEKNLKIICRKKKKKIKKIRTADFAVNTLFLDAAVSFSPAE